MATADELLAGTSTVDKTLVISNDLRTINIPSSVTNLGVESDDDVLRLNFKMPRYVSDTDLSAFSIRINYMNAKGGSDVYTVSNHTVGAQHITFSWLVGPVATAYKGETKFNVCLRTFKTSVDDNGDTVSTVDREYNTTITSLPVLEGLEVDESSIESYSDLLEQWRRELFGIGDTEEASIRAASQAEQEAIANKGAEVLATIPADYTAAARMADNADRTKADAIVCSATGSNIGVSDSSDDCLRNLRIFGKTKQTVTTGKNLLPMVSSGFGTRNGVTFTDLGEGKIGAQGTATANTTLVFCSFSPGERTPISAGTYTLSGSPGSVVYLSFFVYADQETDEVLVSQPSLCDGRTWTFTLENDAYYGAYLYVAKGLMATERLAPQLERGSVATEYEAYSGGIPSPSPNRPQELNKICDNAGIGVWVTGKNLLRDIEVPKSHTHNGITSDYEGNGIFHIHGTFSGTNGGTQLSTTQINLPLDPDANYTLSVKLLSGRPPASFHPYLAAASKNNSFMNWLPVAINSETPVGSVITSTLSARATVKDATTIKQFWIYSFNSDLSPYTADFRIQVWLEKGDISTDPEPYKEESTMMSPYTLSGVPVKSGGNYTDDNGQQWICDEIDFDRGVHIQRIGTEVFDGSVDEAWFVTGKQYHIAIKDKRNNYVQVPNGLLCSHFKVDPVTNTSMGYISETYYHNGNINILINLDDGVGGVENFVAWLQSNPITVQYVLAIPIETPLAAEELEWFRFAHTNFPNTALINNIGATMEMKYNTDTYTWIMKEITAIISEKVLSS